jgi:hypothetical protein
MYTLLISARNHGVDPQAYLQDVIERLPGTRLDELDALLPANWASPRHLSSVNRAHSNGGRSGLTNKKAIKLELKDGSLHLNDSKVTTADVKCTNGVIHIIDAVLLPPADKK